MTDTTSIGNDEITVTVAALGAETQSLTTRDGREWMWDGKPEFWTGRAPILFPIVGKSPGDMLTINGADYAMNQHGFARRTGFDLLDESAQSVSYQLKANEETLKVYPFDFSLTVTHRVSGRTLTVSSTVANKGDRDMPFQFGYHPAFLWPLPGAASGDRHFVTLTNGAEPPLVRVREALLDLTPQPSPFKDGVLELKHNYFEVDALVFPEGAGDALTFRAENGPSLSFTFENLPNLALWQKPGAPYLCVEPWHGMAAEFGKGRDIIDRPYIQSLKPGETRTFTFSVTVD